MGCSCFVGQRREWQLDVQRDQDALRMRALGRRLAHRRDREKENGVTPTAVLSGNPQLTARGRGGGGPRSDGRVLEPRRKSTGTLDHRSRSK